MRVHIYTARILLFAAASVAGWTQPPAPLEVPSAQESSVLTKETVSQRLSTLTPSIPAPVGNLFGIEASRHQSLCLLGVDLIQENTAIVPGAPVLDGNRPLHVRAYWMPAAPVQNTMPLEFRFQSRDTMLSKSQEQDAGPAPGGKAWQPGCVYPVDYALPMQNVATNITGYAYFSISFVSTELSGPATIPLMSIPLEIRPAIGPRNASARRIEVVFGVKLKDFALSFRLGPGARQEIRTPENWGASGGALGLISAFSYGSVAQGKPVCRIVVRDKNGIEATLDILSGLHTARTDYDYKPASEVDHQKVTILESMPAEYRNQLDQPFEKHKYAGAIALPETLGAIHSIKFQSASPVVFDIYDVVLLDEMPPAFEQPQPTEPQAE